MDRQTLQIAERLAQYCMSHPKALDTFSGVAQWWLSTTEGLVPLEVIEAAIELLAQRGVLTKHRLSDGTIVFRCSPPGSAPTATSVPIPGDSDLPK